jgi:hypothetical protein
LLLVTSFALSVRAEPNTAHSFGEFTAKRAPEPHLYWHFLLYQNYLDRQAAVREKQGKDGQWLRNHFQERLHFTDAQFAIVRQEGLRLETELNAIAAQVKPIIAQDRAWIKLHGRSVGPPPGHHQVQELRKQREAIIQDEVAKLNQALGAETAAKFQAFIDTEWAPDVTVRTVRPHAHDPKNNRPVPWHMEARQ